MTDNPNDPVSGLDLYMMQLKNNLDAKRDKEITESLELLRSLSERDSTKTQPISYDSNQKSLFVNNRYFDFSGSQQAHGLLVTLFSNTSNLTEFVTYEKFLFKYGAVLGQYGISEPSHIRTAKRNIQNKVLLNDLFPHRGFLVVNRSYL